MTTEQTSILTAIQVTIERMDHELFGNGQPGRLKEMDTRIDTLIEFKSVIKGGFYAISAVVTLIGTTEIYHLFFGTK